ncbi:unnamed protein product [Gordionus sp. m RMFG-2023]
MTSAVLRQMQRCGDKLLHVVSNRSKKDKNPLSLFIKPECKIVKFTILRHNMDLNYSDDIQRGGRNNNYKIPMAIDLANKFMKAAKKECTITPETGSDIQECLSEKVSDENFDQTKSYRVTIGNGKLGSISKNFTNLQDSMRRMSSGGSLRDLNYYEAEGQSRQAPSTIDNRLGVPNILEPESNEDVNRNSGMRGGKEEGKVAHWAVTFDNLLRDSEGLKVFEEFLRKEYSEENIEFWKECEALKALNDVDLIKSKGKSIFEHFLADNALCPVNINDYCRQAVKDKLLNQPDETLCYKTLFEAAQTQIYNLMRYDSYARFLKSNIYKNCLIAELEKKTYSLMEPRKSAKDLALKGDKLKGDKLGLEDTSKKWKTNLFFSKTKFDNLLSGALTKGINLTEDSKIKSKYAEDMRKRRQGLVANDITSNDTPDLSISQPVNITKTSSSITFTIPHQSNSDMDSKLIGLDNQLGSLYNIIDLGDSFYANDQSQIPLNSMDKISSTTFHIVIGSGSDPESILNILVVPKRRILNKYGLPEIGICEENNKVIDIKDIHPNVTVKRMLTHICRWKRLNFSAVDVYSKPSLIRTTSSEAKNHFKSSNNEDNTPKSTTKREMVDLNQQFEIFLGKDLYVEKRIIFEMVLPIGKCIGVKTKPEKRIKDVLNPILSFYHLKPVQELHIYRKNDYSKLDPDEPIENVDKETIIISSLKASSSDPNLLSFDEPRLSAEDFVSLLTSTKDKNVNKKKLASKRVVKRSLTSELVSDLKQGISI